MICFALIFNICTKVYTKVMVFYTSKESHKTISRHNMLFHVYCNFITVRQHELLILLKFYKLSVVLLYQSTLEYFAIAMFSTQFILLIFA